MYLGRHQGEVLGGNNLISVNVVARHESLALVLTRTRTEFGHFLEVRGGEGGREQEEGGRKRRG